MNEELIERLREAATAFPGEGAIVSGIDLGAAANALEQTEAARMAAISRLCEAEVACATACQERDALAAELKALRARAIELEAETKSSEEMQTLKFCEREWSTERAAMMNTIHALRNCGDALAAELKALLEQEPVYLVCEPNEAHWRTVEKWKFDEYPEDDRHALYARPIPARYITNEAIEEMAEDFLSTDGDEAPLVVGYVEFARAIEAALMGEGE